MRRLLDTLAGVMLTAFIINLLFNMIKPYTVQILIAAFVYLVGVKIVRHFGNW